MKKTIVLKIDPENPDKEKIEEAVNILKKAGLVAFPTETVYGLAALITEKRAVQELRTIKQRPKDKKFAMCIHSIDQVEQFTGYIPPLAYKLMKKFWPGPLTLVLADRTKEKIGFRMPDNNVAQLFLRKLEIPVFAPSANLTGSSEPVSAEDVLKDLDGRIDAVIDAGRTSLGVASTVCAVEDDTFTILRKGAVTKEMIEEISKYKKVLFVCTGNSCRSAMAQGLMKKLISDNEYIKVDSAGVAALDGMPATREAVEVMKKEGIDISEHKSKKLTEQMIKESDCILVMEHRHKKYITERVPQAETRTFLLKEFDKEEHEVLTISDPIGLGINFYEEAVRVIKNSIERLVLKLK